MVFNLLHEIVQVLFIFSCIVLGGIHFDDVCCSRGVADKPEVNDDQNDDDQNDATTADMLRIHLNDLFHFN